MVKHTARSVAPPGLLRSLIFFLARFVRKKKTPLAAGPKQMVREATTKDDIIKVQHAYDALEEQVVVGPDRVLRGLKREWPTFPFGRDAIWYVLDRLKPAASPEDIRVHYGSGRGRKTTKVAPELFQKTPTPTPTPSPTRNAP